MFTEAGQPQTRQVAAGKLISDLEIVCTAREGPQMPDALRRHDRDGAPELLGEVRGVDHVLDVTPHLCRDTNN